jgi:predicted SAM-dependent methyltransferase
LKYSKLNVGSRDVIKPADEGWLNIDIMPLPRPRENFEVQDALHLPETWANQFEEIHAVHVLEHINRNFRQDFVTEMFRITAPGGACYIEVPDFKETVRLLHEAYLREDLKMQHIWTTSIYGKQRSPGDQHCWGFTHATLTELFHQAGFTVTVWNTGYERTWRNDLLKPISTHYKQEPCLLVKGIKS